MTPVYLIVTSKRDLTSDFVILELQRRGLDYVRLNTEDISRGVFSCRPCVEDAWNLELPNTSLDLSHIKAAYFRRPGAPALPEGVSEAEQPYCTLEWHATLQALYWAIGERWLNAPYAIALAENKIRQLTVAQSLGLQIPETLVSNDPFATTAFAKRGGIVGKPLRSAVVKGYARDRIVFTSRVSIDANTEPLSIKACPMILQREIKKQFDVRVTVVGERVFAATIDSQSRPETEVDWRRTSEPNLPHASYRLPEKIEAQCVALTARLGLKFGALDFVLDPEGQFWFLEINPNGQWGWIETRTGHPIASAIVSEMEQIANGSRMEKNLATT